MVDNYSLSTKLSTIIHIKNGYNWLLFEEYAHLSTARFALLKPLVIGLFRDTFL